MSAEKRKKIKASGNVPEPGDPDRRRVLNVLAQRRYRKRRKEKIAELEANAKCITPPTSSHSPDGRIHPDSENAPTSSLMPTPEINGEIDIEEVIRSANDSVGFPGLDFSQEPIDFGVYSNWGFSNLSSYNSLSAGPSSQWDPYNQPTPFAFPLTPDCGQLDVPLLPALRAFGTIATALDVTSYIWDPSYQHVLPPTPHPSLPSNLHPTPAQTTIPHHPLIDILPWPSVREKLVCMLSLPAALRPPVARDEDGDGQGRAITQILQDLDDTKDGLRNHGNMSGWGNGNELVEEAWEIGECFYRHWWWCLDRSVVELSNRRRKERGLGNLRIGG